MSSSPGAEPGLARELAGAAGGLLPRCTFPAPGSALDCGVSGGADSLALLALAVAAGCRARAVHVDHGLRAGSAAEADVVRAAADRLGAVFEARRVRVEPGPNLEARARKARLEALGPQAATGHTADDQAETILLNLMRGAGLRGLAGMRPGPRHPILALRRAEAVQLCARLGLEPVADPTNTDPRFRRNRVRHEVMPLLNAVAGRDVAAVLARQAAHLNADADLLDALAEPVDPTSVAALEAAPAPVARRALRRWLTDSEGHPPDTASLERVLAVVRKEVRSAQLEGGVTVSRRVGRLYRTDSLEARERAGG